MSSSEVYYHPEWNVLIHIIRCPGIICIDGLDVKTNAAEQLLFKIMYEPVEFGFVYIGDAE